MFSRVQEEGRAVGRGQARAGAREFSPRKINQREERAGDDEKARRRPFHDAHDAGDCGRAVWAPPRYALMYSRAMNAFRPSFCGLRRPPRMICEKSIRSISTLTRDDEVKCHCHDHDVTSACKGNWRRTRSKVVLMLTAVW